VLALRAVRGRLQPPPTAVAASPLLALLLLLAGIAGCDGEGGSRDAVQRQREWVALQAGKHALAAERRELATLRARLAAAPLDPEGRPLGDGDRALAADVEARARRVNDASAQLGERLVRHIAGFPPGEADQLPPGLAAAIRLKSDEDVEVAQEWIDRGGDYRRAIEILEMQLPVDPGYARLEQALVRAREMRFVTAERLAKVTPGMAAAEVRAALGPVNLHEVHRRPAERLEAWYYPRQGGGRAAVYFRYDAERGGYVVYRTELAADGMRPATASVTG